jgi:hypothetical protein
LINVGFASKADIVAARVFRPLSATFRQGIGVRPWRLAAPPAGRQRYFIPARLLRQRDTTRSTFNGARRVGGPSITVELTFTISALSAASRLASGLQWDENLPWNDKNDEWHLVNDPDPLRYVFQKPFAFAPDTFFTYNGGGTDLLGKVIEKASGVRIDALCERGPLSTARHHRLAVEGISQRQTSNGSRPAPAPA